MSLMFCKKNHKSKNIGSTISFCGLVMLFPGYFIYHNLIRLGWTPPLFMGGFWGFISAVLFPISLCFVIRSIFVLRGHSLRVAIYSLLVICYILACAVTSLLAADETVYIFFRMTVENLLFWIVLIFIGIFFRIDQSSLKLVLFLYVIMTGFIIVNSTFFPIADHLINRISAYQGLARSYMVWGFLVLALTIKRKVIYWGSVFISISALFLIGARSEFAAYIFAVIILSLCIAENKLSIVLMLLIGVSILSLISSYVQQTRVVEILNIFEATSFLARWEAQKYGFGIIMSHPILGNFSGGYQGGNFSYAHSVLSAWVHFGIIGFIMYYGLNMYTAWIGFREVVIRGSRDSLTVFCFLIVISWLALILVSKSIWAPLGALGWGLVIQLLVPVYSTNKHINFHKCIKNEY